jgi:NAD+--asparagine ADP-ribosyltransferase
MQTLNGKIMNLIAIEDKILQDILSKLEALDEKTKSAGESPEHKWLDNQEFCFLLKISKRTAQNYRDQALVAFSQIGSKVYYKLSDVHALLEFNRVAAERFQRR